MLELIFEVVTNQNLLRNTTAQDQSPYKNVDEHKQVESDQHSSSRALRTRKSLLERKHNINERVARSQQVECQYDIGDNPHRKYGRAGGTSLSIFVTRLARCHTLTQHKSH